MYNFYREPWLLDRLAGGLDEVYGHAPASTGRDGRAQVGTFSMLTHRHGPGATRVRRRPGLRAARSSPPATDDRPFVYLQDAVDPVALPVDPRPDPDRLGARRAPGRRQVRRDARLPRPLLHGRGLPAARDQVRGAVRAAVRHDVVRQRARVRRHLAGDPAPRSRSNVEPGSATWAVVLVVVRRAAGRRPRAGLMAALARDGAALPGRLRARLLPGLHREPRLRRTVPRHGGPDHGVRREPPRRDGRRGAGVPLADHRATAGCS